MKRALVVLLSLVLGALSAQAAYRLYLQDGKVILLDEQPVIQGNMAYFVKAGVTYYLPTSQLDQAKTEKENKPAETAPAAVKAPFKPQAASAPMIDEEQLDIIRKRSRLANEGELDVPPPPPQGVPQEGEGGQPSEMPRSQAPVEGGAAALQQRAAVQARLTDLLAQRATLAQQQNDMRAQISVLTDKFNFSTQQSEKAALQQQLDSLQDQLAQVNNQAATITSQIQSTQQELATIPVVVDRGKE